jgi:hypothetical protein
MGDHTDRPKTLYVEPRGKNISRVCWRLKVKIQAQYMNHKRKRLRDQALQVQQVFLRTIMECVLLSCLT